MLKFKIKPTLKLVDFNITVFRNLQFHIDPDSYFRRRVYQYNQDEFYFNFDFYHACRNRADQGIKSFIYFLDWVSTPWLLILHHLHLLYFCAALDM